MAQARTNPWLVLVVLTTGFFMILLDTTIVNVAIPAMSAGLNTTMATAVLPRRRPSVASPAMPEENSASTASTSLVARAITSPTAVRSK